jgi:hypothetical protein
MKWDQGNQDLYTISHQLSHKSHPFGQPPEKLEHLLLKTDRRTKAQTSAHSQKIEHSKFIHFFFLIKFFFLNVSKKAIKCCQEQRQRVKWRRKLNIYNVLLKQTIWNPTLFINIRFEKIAWNYEMKWNGSFLVCCTQKANHQDILHELLQEFVKILTGSCTLSRIHKIQQKNSNNDLVKMTGFCVLIFFL